MTRVSQVPCAPSAQGRAEGQLNVVCEADAPITGAATVMWCCLASFHCCGLSFLTDHPPAQIHCWKHAVAQMGATFNCSPTAHLTGLKPSPLHTILPLLARITAKWDTQDSKEQGEGSLDSRGTKEGEGEHDAHARCCMELAMKVY